MATATRIAIVLPNPTPGGTAQDRETPAVVRRAPAVPIATAIAFGILASHAFTATLPVWLIATGTALLAWLFCWRHGVRTASACCLLTAALFLGAGWHHLRWSLVREDHVARFADEAPRPVRIRGRLADQPTRITPRRQELPSAIPQQDHTLATLDCTMLVSGDDEIPVSGLARLDVAGYLASAGVGDLVDVVGQFSRPRGIQNPGEFDFRRYLRTSAIHVVVRCEEPDDVRVVGPAGKTMRGWQARLRSHAERLLTDRLSDQTAAVGTALLLGTRSGITDELRQAFAESGTMHILAISGANVGVLAGLLWILARIVGFGRVATGVIIFAGILGYALLADAQPPVMRAVLMFTALLAGRPWFRTAPVVNGLALSALGVLIWNPSHLFDVGAQLSFLAVGALIWAPSWLPRHWTHPPGDIEVDSTPWVAWLRRMVPRTLLLPIGTLASVWIFTLPLTMARFHLLSPVGLVVNLLLAPVVVLVMWSGYALLMVGLLFPAAGAPFGTALDLGLRLMIRMVEESAAIDWGHLYLAGPGDVWLAGYYVCLLAVACGLRGARLRQWGWRALLVWTVGGLGWGLIPHRTDELRCTVLSVGHGLAVLIEMPNGKTILYDAGQMQNGSRAAATVRETLWARGLHRIDALVVSHADVDHFNGVPGLARTIPVGEVLCHPSFLDFGQESVRITCDRLAARKVPIRTIWAGDRLMLDGQVGMRIRHPQANDRDRLDNANSLVVEVEYAGRKLLLTGDLEQQGLRKVLAQPRFAGDVLLAPHHGSLAANTRELADWAGAEWVLVSGNRNDPSQRLHSIYAPPAKVLSTAERGALTIVVTSDGALRCETFRE